MAALDYWGHNMSGMEPLLIGAALGAGVGGVTSAIRGGDPLQGALLGGITGAATGGFSNGLSTVGSTAQAGANTAIDQVTQQAINAQLIESGTSGVLGDVVEQAALSGLEYSSSPFLAGAQHLMREPGTTLAAMFPSAVGKSASNMAALAGQLPSGQKQPQMSAPQMRRGQAPKVQAPIEELMRMQMMAQRQRRPISLL